MRFTDIIATFPDLLFIIMISAAVVETPFFGLMNGLLATFVAIGLIAWVGTARLVRAETLSLKQREDIEAARAVGVPEAGSCGATSCPRPWAPSRWRSAWASRWPSWPSRPCRSSASGSRSRAPRGAASSTRGSTASRCAPWLVFPPMIALAIALIGFTLLGDGMRDAFDPRASRRR